MSTEVSVRPAQNAAAESNTQAAVAAVQAKMLVAQSRPRNERRAIEKIEAMCTRPKLAESALYSYARGGQEITGPSIRLAEAIAQAWGNLTFGIRELEQRGGVSVVEAFCHDMESNTEQVKVFHVAHTRHTRQGSKKLDDPRDIYELVANQGARRLRACILGIIPGDVIEAAVSQCEATMKTTVEVTPGRIKAMVAKFADIGVTREMIEARIQRRVDSMNAPLMIQLGKIFTSIKDGMSSASDWFETPAKSAAAALNAPKSKALPDPADDVHQGEAAIDESQVAPDEPSEPGEYEKLRDIIDNARHPSDLRSLDGLIEKSRVLLTNDQFADLTKRLKDRRKDGGK